MQRNNSGPIIDPIWVCMIGRLSSLPGCRLIATIAVAIALVHPAYAEERLVELTLTPSMLRPGEVGEVGVTYQVPDGQYLALQEEFLRFELLPTHVGKLGEISYPPGTPKGGGVVVYREALTLTAPFYPSTTSSPGEYQLTILVHYQYCDEDGLCFPPVVEEVVLQFTLEPGENTGSGISKLLQILLFALVGGVLLNIMPCVLPVLSLKVLSLLKSSQFGRGGFRSGSLLYSAGVVFSMLVLAAVVVGIKLADRHVGWGFQFQNPAFVLSLLVVVFLFGLSLFDLFTISVPTFRTHTSTTRGKGRVSSFMNGAFAVVLATPCTAPLLGVAMGFAFSQPPWVIVLIFLITGLGLALPFLLLAFFPGVARFLPKPGNWMNRFKQAMGILLLGTSVWLLSVLVRQIGGQNLIGVLVFLFFLAVAAWLLGWLTNPANRRTVRILGVFLFAAIAVASWLRFVELSQPVEGETTQTVIPAGWQEFTPDGVMNAVASGEPVLLSFGAAWCLTCKTNELTVLHTEWAEKLFEAGKITRFYGDYTNESPVITKWLEEFGRSGVPFTCYYPPGSQAPRILPEILTRRILEEAILN